MSIMGRSKTQHSQLLKHMRMVPCILQLRMSRYVWRVQHCVVVHCSFYIILMYVVNFFEHHNPFFFIIQSVAKFWNRCSRILKILLSLICMMCYLLQNPEFLSFFSLEVWRQFEIYSCEICHNSKVHPRERYECSCACVTLKTAVCLPLRWI
jgi:hypothetical protein